MSEQGERGSGFWWRFGSAMVDRLGAVAVGAVGVAVARTAGVRSGWSLAIGSALAGGVMFWLLKRKDRGW